MMSEEYRRILKIVAAELLAYAEEEDDEKLEMTTYTIEALASVYDALVRDGCIGGVK